MEWKALKDQLASTVKTTAKTCLAKADELGATLASHTGATIATVSDLTASLKQARRTIVIVGRDEHPEYHRLLLLYPILRTRAWTEMITLYYCDTTTSPELVRHLEITTDFTVLSYEDDKIAKRCETKESIEAFLKDFKN